MATIDAASKTFAGSSFGTLSFGPLLLLLPWLAFYLLWPNWGATLYGEVRGAKDIRKPFWSLFAGLWVTVAMVVAVILLTPNTSASTSSPSPTPRPTTHLMP